MCTKVSFFTLPWLEVNIVSGILKVAYAWSCYSLSFSHDSFSGSAFRTTKMMKREFPGSATIVVIHASNLFITFLDWNRADLRCGSNVRESPDWFGPESRGWNCQHRLHRTRNLAAWKFPCQLHENGEKNANKILFFYFLEKYQFWKTAIQSGVTTVDDKLSTKTWLAILSRK